METLRQRRVMYIIPQDTTIVNARAHIFVFVPKIVRVKRSACTSYDFQTGRWFSGVKVFPEIRLHPALCNAIDNWVLLCSISSKDRRITRNGGGSAHVFYPTSLLYCIARTTLAILSWCPCVLYFDATCTATLVPFILIRYTPKATRITFHVSFETSCSPTYQR